MKRIHLPDFALKLWFAIALLLCSSAWAQSLPARTTPRGMSNLATGGSGRVLATKLSGSRSATKLFQALLTGVRGYFDATPRILNAFRDAADTQIQASFRSSLKGVQVLGLIGLATQGTQARAVLLFDTTRAFPNSVGRLVSAATSGGTAPSNVQLTRVSFPDGSATIGLPRGWRLMFGQKGAADIAGPQPYSGMSLGAAAPIQYVSSDPIQTIVTVARQVAQQQGKNIRVTVLDSKPTPWPNGRAAFAYYRVLLDGHSIDYFGLFAVMPIDNTQVLFYSSFIQAATSNFAQVLPIGMKIWGSWSINPAVFAERLQAAAQSMRETSAILSSANSNRQRAFDGINAGWSEYIRDVATLEDSDGNRSQVNQSFADNVVQNNPNQYRIVPPSQLLPR